MLVRVVRVPGYDPCRRVTGDRTLDLYCNSDFVIEDGDGNQLTAEQAKAEWESGNVTNSNFLFDHLVKYNFDIEALKSLYYEYVDDAPDEI